MSGPSSPLGPNEHRSSPDPRAIDDLILQIKEAADKLASDGSSRGDLKILSRAIRELRYAFKVFSPYRRRRKVTVFGSARLRSDHPAYLQAMDFGRAMAQNDWMVVTGAASGIMEAGHRGAGRDHSLGLNIILPFEQSANAVIAGDSKLVHMKYFFTRKLMFVKECDAVVCFPGGFGTLDEAMEVITLLQTGKREMVPVVFVQPEGSRYWERLHEFIVDELLAPGMISPEDLSLYKITDNYAAAVGEILAFFRTFHSMRFVKQRLVFRLHRELTGTQLRVVNDRFSDLLAEGDFSLSEALGEESDAPELADLPRLVFAYNRRNYGRLRQLIDHLNELGP